MAMWSCADISSAETKYSGSLSTSPPSSRYRRQEWSSTAYSAMLPSASRLRRLYIQENGGSMPLEALSAKARLTVPVGAIDSRWLLRMPCARIFFLMSAGSRLAKVPSLR